MYNVLGVLSLCMNCGACLTCIGSVRNVCLVYFSPLYEMWTSGEVWSIFDLCFNVDHSQFSHTAHTAGVSQILSLEKEKNRSLK